ncbi:hypothetical protein E2C01_095568 [Portunus trituberculatus]|uniref:Uncharacterized protein n=1 Tax=Portunus trituberculatus TaxID=210409 RepID=A0A5B7JZQ9_PORTR|nr:hypothetical protein [Portunus trituberculatus]
MAASGCLSGHTWLRQLGRNRPSARRGRGGGDDMVFVSGAETVPGWWHGGPPPWAKDQEREQSDGWRPSRGWARHSQAGCCCCGLRGSGRRPRVLQPRITNSVWRRVLAAPGHRGACVRASHYKAIKLSSGRGPVGTGRGCGGKRQCRARDVALRRRLLGFVFRQVQVCRCHLRAAATPASYAPL